MNGGRLAHDSAFDLSGFGLHAVEGALPAGQFLTRWITHLCAPTFLFLSGTSLALSTVRRQAKGATPGEIDRHLCIRGALLLVIEAVWFSPLMSAPAGHYMLVMQVLFAIGAGLLLMIPLRRLESRWLLALGLAWFVVGEAITLGLAGIDTAPPGWLRVLLSPGAIAGAEVLYPVLPWLAMMAMGWAFGERLARMDGASAAQTAGRLCLGAGAASLALFGLVRTVNGYGNMALLRRNDTWLEWLFVSKYPPSLSFAALELGLMGVLLGGMFLLQRRVSAPHANNPLLILGQTALFFYLLHFHLLAIGGAAIGWIGSRGLPTAYAAALAVTAFLVPICRAYGRYKRRHPDGWAQYV
jgi:uncharacterized membrane protein